MRPMADVMPAGVDWLHTAVAGFDPDTNSITTTDGATVKYDYLVVVSGGYRAAQSLGAACTLASNKGGCCSHGCVSFTKRLKRCRRQPVQ